MSDSDPNPLQLRVSSGEYDWKVYSYENEMWGTSGGPTTVIFKKYPDEDT